MAAQLLDWRTAGCRCSCCLARRHIDGVNTLNATLHITCSRHAANSSSTLSNKNVCRPAGRYDVWPSQQSDDCALPSGSVDLYVCPLDFESLSLLRDINTFTTSEVCMTVRSCSSALIHQISPVRQSYGWQKSGAVSASCATFCINFVKRPGNCRDGVT